MRSLFSWLLSCKPWGQGRGRKDNGRQLTPPHPHGHFPAQHRAQEVVLSATAHRPHSVPLSLFLLVFTFPELNVGEGLGVLHPT